MSSLNWRLVPRWFVDFPFSIYNDYLFPIFDPGAIETESSEPFLIGAKITRVLRVKLAEGYLLRS